MKIVLYADSAYTKTLWFAHILSGIGEEAAKKRHEIVILDSIPEDASSLIPMFEGAKPIVVVTGASTASLASPLRSLWNAGIHTILVNYMQELPTQNSSAIIMDYADAVKQGLCHMRSRGAENIAFVGDYPDSGPDTIKRNSFIAEQRLAGVENPESDIYQITQGIEDCCNRFFASEKHYDAILFGNDIVAIALYRSLRERKSEKSTILTGFADPILSDFTVLIPEMTTLSANHSELGRQAVFLCNYLEKNPSDISITLRVPISLHRAGTDELPLADSTIIMSDISNDSLARDILRVERCLASCELLDKKIINELLSGKNQAEISRAVYASERTIKYRLSKLCNIAEVKNTAELIELIRPYLGKSNENH